jgi:hypothetical protein
VQQKANRPPVSKPQSQEVVARSDFGLYDLGWYRRSARISPRDIAKYLPIPPYRQLPAFNEGGEPSTLHQPRKPGTCKRRVLRLVRSGSGPGSISEPLLQSTITVPDCQNRFRLVLTIVATRYGHRKLLLGWVFASTVLGGLGVLAVLFPQET